MLLLLLAGDDEDFALFELLPCHVILAAGGLVEEADALLLGHAAGVGVVIRRAELLRYAGADVEIADGLADGRAARFFIVNRGELAGGHVVAEVVHLVLCDDGEDDIGKVAVVLKPRVLGHDAFDALVLIRPCGEVAVVPARHLTRRVGPDHVDAAEAGAGVLHLLELVLLRRVAVVVADGLLARGEALQAPPFGVTLQYGLVDVAAGDELQRRGELLEEVDQLRRPLLLRRRELEAAGDVDVGLDVAVHGTQRVGDGRDLRDELALIRHRVVLVPEIPFDHLRLMHAGLADAAHAEQHDLEPGRLRRVRAADVAAAVAVDDRCGLPGPVTGEGLDRPLPDAALLTGPGRGLRHAVLAAEDVVLEFVEAVGVGRDVVLVIRPLGDPDIRDRELQRHVGIRQDGDPLVGVDGGAVVQVGADVDAFQADLAEPVAEPARHMRHDAERRRLRVAAPEKEQIGVPGDVGVEVRLRGHLADRLAAPDVFRPPEPALPRVHVAHLQRVPAHEGEKPVRAAVGRGDVLALAVHIGLTQHRLRPVFFLLPHKLVRDDLRRLVPAYTDVFRFAPVLRIALAVGIPVHTLEGIAHPVRGVDAGFVAEAERRDRHTIRGLERLAAGVYLPRVAVFFGVFLIVDVWPDAGDAAAGRVYLTRRAALRPHEARGHDGLMLGHKFIRHESALLCGTSDIEQL